MPEMLHITCYDCFGTVSEFYIPMSFRLKSPLHGNFKKSQQIILKYFLK